MIEELGLAYLRAGVQSLALWLPDGATRPLGRRIRESVEGHIGLHDDRRVLDDGISALSSVRIDDAVRNLTAVATLPCRKTDIDKLRLKETACLYLGVALLQGQGRLDDAVFWWRERNRIAATIARHYGAHDPSEQIFDQFWPSHIGHTALLAIYVKRNLLQGRPYRKFYLLCPDGLSHGNRCLVDHWRNHFTLVAAEEQMPFSPEYLRYTAKNIYLEPLSDGVDNYFWQAYAEISRAWEQGGFGPLLALSHEELRRGDIALESLGVPKNAWYVCLHARSAGYKNMHDDLHDTLNADIYSYDLAVGAIVERGGWVIRMGDPSMPQLPPMTNVIDYAHSRQKSALMDIFLCATCRFYVGTSSGLAYVPPLFGVRSVLTNWFPVGTRPLNSDDLFIPKLHQYDADNRYVPFADSLAPPLGHIHARHTLAALGISVKDNTREDLRDIVIEMIDRLDNRLVDAADDEPLQARFNAVADTSRSYGNARIGRDFIRKHENLLPPEPRADGPS
jgi:putative glycosyltransferase (TIGR04372 family)